MYLFLKNQHEADNRSALTQKQDWILSRTESVAHFFVMNIIISLFSGEENRFLCSLTKNRSPQISADSRFSCYFRKRGRIRDQLSALSRRVKPSTSVFSACACAESCSLAAALSSTPLSPERTAADRLCKEAGRSMAA